MDQTVNNHRKGHTKLVSIEARSFLPPKAVNDDGSVMYQYCFIHDWYKFLFDELRDWVVNEVVTQLKAKLLAVRYLVKVSWNSKGNFELTWDEISKRRRYCDNHDLSRVGNQSIERDRLIEIGLVMDLVKFLSFTFGGKEMTFVVLDFLH
ncbi:hypothetical protein Tco_0708134 [Tanacetum coccineum]